MTETVARADDGATPPHASTTTPADLAAIERHIADLEMRSASVVRPTLREADALLASLPLDQEAMRARLDMVVAVAKTRLGRFHEGVASIRDVRSWAIERGEALVQARAERNLAMLMRRAGVIHTGLEHAIASVTLLGPDVPDSTRADHLLGLADSLALVGSDEESLERYHEALAVAERVGDVNLVLRVVNNLAYTYYELDRLEEALPLCDRLAELGATGGTLSSWALGTISEIYLGCGLVERAAQVLESVDLEKVDDVDDKVDVLICRAGIKRASGDLDAAFVLLDNAAEVAEEHGIQGVEIRLLRQRAEMYAERGDWRSAYELAIEMHDRSASQQKEAAEARVRMAQAVVEVSEARRESAEYREMSYRDPLTGLHNRRYIDDHLDESLDASRKSRQPVSVAFVDLDHFKDVNDQHSHEVGDRVLQMVGRLLTGAVAGVSDAIVARMGGEELLLVLPATSDENARTVAERACAMVREHAWELIAPELKVTASLGVASSPVDGYGRLELLRAADHRLYLAKSAGRDRVIGTDEPGA